MRSRGQVQVFDLTKEAREEETTQELRRLNDHMENLGALLLSVVLQQGATGREQ